jgi:hypothetical protein
MSALSIQVPYQIFADSDGTPLDNGYVWIGTTNLDPRTNPINVYFDAALTQVAPNPLRTVNGYVYNAGSPAQLYIDAANFSIRVEDKKSVLVYSFPAGSGISPNASGVVYTPAGTGAVATTVQSKLRTDLKSVTDFGALGSGADESAAASAMIAAYNYLYVPSDFTLVAKNIALANDTVVICDGVLKLPSACSDFDRLIYGAGLTGVSIDVKEIDGNYAGQSGSIGTHLVYLTNCTDPSVKVRYVHDHYIASGATMPSVDGIRNSSSGAVFVYRGTRANVDIGLLEGWGREGVYLEECTYSDVELGFAKGHATRNTEYSGIQVSGTNNKLLRASVDFAGASAVGFDTAFGSISNIVATNTRENHGVNFGHTGWPASGSVASGIVVDGAYLDGIKVSASTVDLSIGDLSVKNAGRYGVSVSDSSVRGKLTNGVVTNSGQANIQVSATDIQPMNVRSSGLDTVTVEVTTTSGAFSDGEIVTASGGKSATVRKVIRNLSLTKQILFLTGVTGTFATTNVLTGSTSGAVGTAITVSTPVQYLEQASGTVMRDTSAYFSGSAGNQTRFSDGTAIMEISVAVAGVAATTATTVTNYTSNVLWVSAPTVVVSLGSVSSTYNAVVHVLAATTSTTQLTTVLRTDTTQTYGLRVLAIGRWK